MKALATIRRFYEDLFSAAFVHTVEVWYGDTDSAAQVIALCFGADLFVNIAFPIISVQLARHGPTHLLPIWPILLLAVCMVLHFVLFTAESRYTSMVERFRQYGDTRKAALKIVAWTYLIGSFVFAFALIKLS
jgi:hypothetical protein